MKEIVITFLLLSFGFVSATEITQPGSFRNGYIENKGQIIDQNNQPNPAVKYLFNGNGLNVQLKANGFSYDTYSITRSGNSQVNSPIGINDKFSLPDTNCMYHFHRVDIEFIGANPAPQIIAEQPSNYYFNYYTTGTPEEGVTNVRTYQSVTYKNLYEGIDLEFDLSPPSTLLRTGFPSPKESGDSKLTTGSSSPPAGGRSGGVKYNFIIHPGADASQIKWKYNGAFSTSMQEGKIILSVEAGNLEEQLPASFVNETSEKMNVNYLTSADHVYSFAVPSYNKNSTLTIDPLPWATYFGGAGITNGYSISVDTANNVISTGYTNSTSSVATAGAFQTSFGGGSYDAFIFKQNDSGSCLWATYYGGPGYDFAESIGTDVSGNIMIAGYTNSAIGIATPGTQQYSIGGGWDAFAAKFSPSGGRIWGTYFGGDAEDRAFAMAINPAGGFCITGYTLSGGLSTGGAYQTSIVGSPSAFVAKFTASGILTWSTYYSGSGNFSDTRGFGAFIDVNGNVLVTGECSGSTSGLGSIGAYQTSLGGTVDAFIVKFNPSGSTRLWGTYFGGSGNDFGQSITCDSNFNVIVTGYTGSTANISTSGAAQTTYGGSSEDGFVSKFDSSGSMQWATYIGGSGLDRGYGVVTDSSGNIIVCGVTGSATNIATTGSFQPNFGGPLTSGFDDIFIEKYNASGYRLWGTYYGGSGNEFGCGIALDKNKNILITGYGNDTSAAITTFGAYQTTCHGSFNAIVASFTHNGMLPVKLLSFTAKEMGRTTDNTHVLLQWQTASEVNNDHFDVERSNDGMQFTEIGSVKACLSDRQGIGSHSLQNYQFTDNCPIIDHDGPTALYYQLKQIDNDGKYTYSNVVCVQLTQPNLTDIVIMPNPSKGVFNITRSIDKGDVSIDVFDLLGHNVYHAPTVPEQMQIDLSEWGSGIYFIRFSSGVSTSIRKIVIE